jgi:hypothetical protein
MGQGIMECWEGFMRHSLKIGCLAVLIAQAACGVAQAQFRLDKSEDWKNFEGASGLSVRYPSGIFAAEAGPTEKGAGQKFKSRDGRYEFAAYSIDNAGGDTPRAYLQKNLLVPQAALVYRRATRKFFVISSIRNERIFYSRCNFAGRIHCVYLEYPQADKVAWDGIVSRVSYSLRPR